MAPSDQAPATMNEQGRGYKLVVLQQPDRARMCGGTRRTDGRTDRRPIDPPPIVRLEVTGVENSQAELSRLLLSPGLFCHAALCHPTTYQEITSLSEYRTGVSGEMRAGSASPVSDDSDSVGSPRSSTSDSHSGSAQSGESPALCSPVFGTTVSSLHRVRDADGAFMGVFVFSDISVRIEATFRLRFSLFEFEPVAGKTVLRATVFSQPFRVYHAKNFPGMTESTYLSKLVAMQSVKMRVRKERPTVAGSPTTHPRARASNQMARLVTAALGSSPDVGVAALAQRSNLERNAMSAASVAAATVSGSTRSSGTKTAMSDGARPGTSAFRPFDRHEFSTDSSAATQFAAAATSRAQVDGDYDRFIGISALESLAAAASREDAAMRSNFGNRLAESREQQPVNHNSTAFPPAGCAPILPPLKSLLHFAYAPMPAPSIPPPTAMKPLASADAYQFAHQPTHYMPYFPLPIGL